MQRDFCLKRANVAKPFTSMCLMISIGCSMRDWQNLGQNPSFTRETRLQKLLMHAVLLHIGQG